MSDAPAFRPACPADAEACVFASSDGRSRRPRARRPCWSPTGRTASPASSTCTSSAWSRPTRTRKSAVSSSRAGIAAKDWAPLCWPPPPNGAAGRGLTAMWIRANLARDGVHDFYPAVGCRASRTSASTSTRCEAHRPRRQPRGAARAADGCARLIYIDPPFNTGSASSARACAPCATRTATAPASRGGATAPRSSAAPPGRTPSTTTWGSSRRASQRRGASSRPTARCSSTSTSREAHYCKVLLDERLRPRLVPQRDHLGLRLRRPAPHALAGQARHDLLVRASTRPLRLPLRRHRPHALHGARPGRPGEGGARQDAHRRVVAHHREPDRQGEDRLPDAEAARDPRAHRAGALRPGRPGARLLRRQRHHRRGRGAPRPRLPAGRRNPEAIAVMARRLAWDEPEVRRRAAGRSPAGRRAERSGPDARGAGSSRSRPRNVRRCRRAVTRGRSPRWGRTRRRSRSRRTSRRR